MTDTPELPVAGIGAGGRFPGAPHLERQRVAPAPSDEIEAQG